MRFNLTFKSLLTSLLLTPILTSALPSARPLDITLQSIAKRQSITAISTAEIETFKPFTFFASAAYCQPANTLAWNCGANCDANSDFQPFASGGDGSSVQFWYVGFSPSQNTIIVAHQGTDPSQIQADATDADAFLTNLDSGLFPGVDSSVEVHSGFAAEQAKTASDILSAVQSLISSTGSQSVTVVGHSLGAAIALIDGIFLPLNLPSNINVQVIGYGLPRVGNQAWANFVDEVLSVTHINNKEDIVPIVPGMFLGYHHPSGELHIMDNNQWVSCPGQDNPSTECIVGDVPNVFDGDESDHDGPYDGVEMGC